MKVPLTVPRSGVWWALQPSSADAMATDRAIAPIVDLTRIRRQAGQLGCKDRQIASDRFAGPAVMPLFTSLRRAAGRGVCAVGGDCGGASRSAVVRCPGCTIGCPRKPPVSPGAGWAQDAQGPAYSETVTWRIRASRPIRMVSGTQPRVRPSVKVKPCTKTVQPFCCPGRQAR